MLRTQRLILRPFRETDRAPFAALNADPTVMQHFPKTLTREESDDVAMRIEAHHAQHGFGFWAVEVLGVAPMIGFLGLSRPSYQTPFTPCVEIGWRFARAYWGAGYATEGARASLAYGFERLGLEEIVSFTVAANTRSWGVMERLGMVRDAAGDFDHPLLANGHPLQRHVLYRLKSQGVGALSQIGMSQKIAELAWAVLTRCRG